VCLKSHVGVRDPKKHQLLENLKKCEIFKQSLVYLGYVIGAREIKIVPVKMESIIKWPNPTNVIVIVIWKFVGQT
jgi:hypothetical protein